ncbi:MAG: TetR/AcrR family transcriptional regulator [Porticoccaceae bacterium]|nr:TetR/AcrR family transcriptional regulator [Porticoccaceae bacterium]
MKKKRTQAERTAISDRKLLEAATELIVERGTQKTTLTDIGERAGYSRGLASSRFGSKEGLFRHMTAVMQQMRDDYRSKLTKGKTGLDAILARVDVVDSLLSEEPVFTRAMFTLWFDAISRHTESLPLLENYITDSHKSIAQTVQRGIDAGEISPNIDPNAFARAYLSYVNGLIYRWMVLKDGDNLSEDLQNFKEYCRHMLKG